MHITEIKVIYKLVWRGHVVAQFIETLCYKVAGSISNGVIEIFH